MDELNADLVVTGGGLGGTAAALSSLILGRSVILTEETKWIGGQLTTQGTPPHENEWIEEHGATASYREMLNRIRAKYLDDYQGSDLAKKAKYLDPGMGSVSSICCEPRVAVSVLNDMLAPYFGTGLMGSPFLSFFDPALKLDLAKSLPLGGLGNPDDMSAANLYFALMR